MKCHLCREINARSITTAGPDEVLEQTVFDPKTSSAIEHKAVFPDARTFDRQSPKHYILGLLDRHIDRLTARIREYAYLRYLRPR